MSHSGFLIIGDNTGVNTRCISWILALPVQEQACEVFFVVICLHLVIRVLLIVYHFSRRLFVEVLYMNKSQVHDNQNISGEHCRLKS